MYIHVLHKGQLGALSLKDLIVDGTFNITNQLVYMYIYIHIYKLVGSVKCPIDNEVF